MTPVLTDESFGHAGFLADQLRVDEQYLGRPAEERARIAGWLAGCPVPGELIDTRGAEAMADRYEDIKFWYSFIEREARDLNPELYDELTSSVKRSPDEPVGKHEAESVPLSYFKEMAPTTTIVGYALPRMAIDYLGAEAKADDPWPKHRIDSLMGLIRQSVKDSVDPQDLMVEIGDRMAEDKQVDPSKLLKHMFAKGWLEEHNAVSMLKSLQSKLESGSGGLCSFYQSLSDHQRAELG